MCLVVVHHAVALFRASWGLPGCGLHTYILPVRCRPNGLASGCAGSCLGGHSAAAKTSLSPREQEAYGAVCRARLQRIGSDLVWRQRCLRCRRHLDVRKTVHAAARCCRWPLCSWYLFSVKGVSLMIPWRMLLVFLPLPLPPLPLYIYISSMHAACSMSYSRWHYSLPPPPPSPPPPPVCSANVSEHCMRVCLTQDTTHG